MPSATRPATREARIPVEDVRRLLDRPLLDLVFEAATVHRHHHDPRKIQCSQLSSIKTGGCPEDCGYCSQSAHSSTPVEKEALKSKEAVVEEARRAKAAGADRFCMGAAWREVRDGEEFDRVLGMVSEVKALGLETCVTLGMLRPQQAARLREAGLDYYNHNLDTSREHYSKIITTHDFDDRLETLRHVREAGIHVCSGGILGMGETREDRAAFLCELSNLNPAPESVPINALVPVEGTPLADEHRIHWTEILRAIATARILMPRAVVRLSAGRRELSDEAQALCFLAGANSVFVGDQLLTTPNPGPSEDARLLELLGLTSFEDA